MTCSLADKSWWCWCVLAGTFYISFTVDGYNFAFGILKLEIEKEYEHSVSKESIAVIGGLVPAIYCLLAPVAFALVAVFSVRTLTICGALLSASGFLLAFANKFLAWGFSVDLIALGIIQGVASALLYGPSINLIPTYFSLKRKALATGITTCGSPVGAIAYGFIMHKLIKHLGWRGSMLVFAGFSSLIVAAGLTFLPKTDKQLQKDERTKSTTSSDDSCICDDVIFEDDVPFMESESDSLLSLNSSRSSLLLPEAKQLSTRKKITEEFRNVFNRELFKDSVFIALIVSLAFSIFGYYVPTLLVTGQAKQPRYHVGAFVQENLITIWGIANLVGRLSVGWLADFGQYCFFFSSLSLFIAGLLASAICLLVFPHVMQLGSIAFICFIITYGFFSAPFITLRSTVVQDLFFDRKQQIARSFGWTLFAEGLVIVGGFSLPTYFNSIDPLWAYLFAAVSFILSAAFLTIPIRHLVLKKQEIKKNHYQERTTNLV